jgi:hypothetical protein
MDTLTRNTVTTQIVLAMGQKYQDSGSTPNKYKEAEIVAMQKMKDIVLKYTDCCLCCGKKQMSCESCEYIDRSYAQCVYGNAVLRAKIENFVTKHGCTNKIKEFVNDVSKLICENSEYKWDRFEELYDLLETKPNSLLGTCFGGPPIADWETLTSFVPSGAALERIQNSKGTWDIQSILDASGARVNLDYFAVVIKEMPIVNGQRLTPKQLFDYFRKNINNFTSDLSVFYPYDIPYDSIKWFSENPLGSIMRIKIDKGVDGDVLTSQYESCCWIFTTLRGPADMSGYHPVSGNRMFGYQTNGTEVTIFTRGTDRTTTWYHSLNGSQIAFDGADKLWRAVQQNLAEYIKNNGGRLADFPYRETIHRPKWVEVRKELTKLYPSFNVPCN